MYSIKSRYSQSIAPWIIWGLAAFFFFAHYFVRVSPSVMFPQIMAEFHVTGAALGVLIGLFYYAYSGMQIPVGLLADTLGARLLLSIAALFCGVSIYLFAQATVIETVYVSRFLFGLVAAAAFVSALKLTVVWFKPSQVALIMGITQGLGMLGAAFGQAPMEWLTQELGWRNTLTYISMGFLLLALLSILLVRNSPSHVHAKASRIQRPGLREFKHVICHKMTWINALYAGLIFTPVAIIGESWGVEFIKAVHQPTQGVVWGHLPAPSFAISLVFMGWLIGGPLAGLCADKWGRRPVMLGSALCGMVLLPCFLYLPHLNTSVIYGLMFALGFTNTGLIASYAVSGEIHSKQVAGFSISITNMCTVLMGALLHPLIGWVLDVRSKGFDALGLPIYSAQDWQLTLSTLPICAALAFIFAFMVKETLVKEKTS